MKLFGANSWSVLVPQALEGVAAVALLYAAVRRVSTHTAGLLAGAALAITPVAALMFRFDNPDALLVLLMTAAAYATVRAIEAGRLRWLVLVGVLIGFAFLTKMLQGLLVVPGFATAYLVAAPVPVSDAGPAPARRPARRWSSRPAGGSRSSSCGRRARGRTSAARRTTACWS